MLILFDIDGTLLLSKGAGRYAMEEAGREVVGPHFSFEGVEFAGRLDPLIFQDGLLGSGERDFARRHDAFRRAYRERLQARLAVPGVAAPLPGVMELLARLRDRPGTTLGLVTGNYPETGVLKLRAAGIDPAWFPVPAWGVDGPTRRHLPGVAMRRATALTGRPADPRRTIVVGDTVHDVDAARSSGCRALAVGTGPSYGVEALRPHAPDLLLEDLSDTAAVLAFLDQVADGTTPVPA